MSQTDKLYRMQNEKGDFSGGLMFNCPGCGMSHAPNVLPGDGPVWGWNESMDKPTFTPSILVRWTQGDPPVTPENFKEYQANPWPQTDKEMICHSFVTDGKIQFLDDCTHDLKGKTVELPNWND